MDFAMVRRLFATDNQFTVPLGTEQPRLYISGIGSVPLARKRHLFFFYRRFAPMAQLLLKDCWVQYKYITKINEYIL